MVPDFQYQDEAEYRLDLLFPEQDASNIFECDPIEPQQYVHDKNEPTLIITNKTLGSQNLKCRFTKEQKFHVLPLHYF